MKKIQFLLVLFLVMFGLLFIVKNDALACIYDSECDSGNCNGKGQCVEIECDDDSDCAANEKCNSNKKCVSRGGEPTAIPQPTATPIPTTTPIPTATPIPTCAKKAQGDADCDGNVTFKDYFYYVAKKAGATLPTTVNVDFDKSGTVDDADRKIVVKTLKP